MLDRLSGLSRRFPMWAGALLVVLGAWTISDAYVAEGWPEQQTLLQRLEARKHARQAEIRDLDAFDLRPRGQPGTRRAGRSDSEPEDYSGRDER